MKKFYAIIAVIFVMITAFAFVGVVCYAAESPEATIYPGDDTNSTGKGAVSVTDGDGGISGKYTKYYTRVSTTYYSKTTSAKTTSVKKTTDSKTTATDVTEKRTTKATKNYLTNEGKDDPNSPNYTGTKTPVKDKSTKGPDMAAENNFGTVAFVVLFMIAASGITVVLTAKKQKED